MGGGGFSMQYFKVLTFLNLTSNTFFFPHYVVPVSFNHKFDTAQEKP